MVACLFTRTEEGRLRQTRSVDDDHFLRSVRVLALMRSCIRKSMRTRIHRDSKTLEAASKRVSERVEIAIRSTLPACFWWQEVHVKAEVCICVQALYTTRGSRCKL